MQQLALERLDGFAFVGLLDYYEPWHPKEVIKNGPLVVESVI